MTRFIILYLILTLITCCLSKEKEFYNPKAIELNNKAIKLMQHFKEDSALLLFDEAIKVDSSYYLPHSNKVEIYIHKNLLNKALHESEMVIKKKPDLAEGWTFAGMLHEKMGDTLIAMEYYKKSIEIFNESISDPSKAKHLEANKLNRVFSLILIGDEIKVRNELNKFKKEFPDNPMIDKLLKINKDDYINQILGIK